MATKQEQETPTILRKLSIFVVLFYLIYYLASIVLVGAFSVGWHELGRFPFRIARDEFDPGQGGGALGAWLAMLVVFVASLGLAFFVVRATRRTWDYMTTTSILHWVLCCLVNLAFPTNWVWWVTIIIGTLIVSGAAEVLIYYLVDLRDIKLDH